MLTLFCVVAGATALPPPVQADPDPTQSGEVLVTAARSRRRIENRAIENPPNTAAAVTADRIATTINAVNVEDTVKYLPSLLVRKRHPGDTQAPLATRTAGLGASARSLIYADGVLLSALIGNNNNTASPRWSMIGAQEVARIDVLYGPFSAAYPGNAIGAVVNITTRLPDRFEATANFGASLQTFRQYGTRDAYPTTRLGLTVGDRFGPLAVFVSADHVASNGQPLTYVVANRPAAPATTGAATTGGYDDRGRLGQPIRVLGASGIEAQVQDRLKLKVALDLTPHIQLAYSGSLFLNDTHAGAETYLRNAAGTPGYAGALNLAGYPYTVANSAFSNGVYGYDERHWSHAVSATGNGERIDWQLVASSYTFDRDVQRVPGNTLPGAIGGGPGAITRLDGTGWRTLGAKLAWRIGAAATHILSAGAHLDRFELASSRFAATDWRRGAAGALTAQSLGKTRTAALWAQDAWRIAPAVTLTVGGRYEWWRAYDGVIAPAPPTATAHQLARRDRYFSPKAVLAWTVAPGWTLRGSFGAAARFPTVGELYQLVTTPVAAIPDPNLKPERAQSGELALEQGDADGTVRLSLFTETIRDALLSQSGPLNGGPTIATFVQNVDRTRARGVEFAWDRRDVVDGFDLSGSITYADAQTRRDRAFAAAQGKTLPGVPRWKAVMVATWRPRGVADGRLALTAAARYAGRFYATIDNSDPVGNTYTGFYRYLVTDLRAQLRATDRLTLGAGVDNLTNERYFLFHPFPQRTVHVDASVRL